MAEGIHCLLKFVLSRLVEVPVFICEICHFTKIVVDNVSIHCRTGILNISLHHLDHIVEDLCRFGMLFVLDDNTFEHNCACIKTSFCITWRPLTRRMEDTVKVFMFCKKGGKMGGTFTEAVNSAAKGKTNDAYSALIVEKVICKGW